MRQINYKKLLNSKWTSLKPISKEKHFTIIKVYKNIDDQQQIDSITIEAILTKRVFKISPKELNNVDVWAEGWL